MTTCAPTDRLIQTLTVEAPGATTDLIELQLFNVMDEFFRRTQAWQMEISIELIEDVTEYAIPIPVNSTVVRTIAVTHNDIPVPPSQSLGGLVQSSLGVVESEMTFPDGDSNFAPALSDLQGGTNVFTWAVYRPDYISVTAPPDEEQRRYALIMFLALTLTKSCLECEGAADWDIPEWQWDMFFEEWRCGTLARLQGMPNKPWFNATMATYHGKRFRNLMGFRKQEAMKGFVYAQPGWLYPKVGGWV